jgi:predicted RNA binding protein YcfA (HicA-like mRNA interferase family)
MAERYDIYSHPERPGIKIPVGSRKSDEVSKGTLHSIPKDAGLKYPCSLPVK